VANPSKWVYSKARSKVVERVREAKARGKGAFMNTGYSADHSGIFADAGKGKCAALGERSYTLDALPGITLDEQAYSKLHELSEEDLGELIEEYFAENAKAFIRNPSGWLYGHARTKAVARTRAIQRASPYMY